VEWIGYSRNCDQVMEEHLDYQTRHAPSWNMHYWAWSIVHFTWQFSTIRKTLDKDPRSNEIDHSYWMRAISWSMAFRWGSKTKKWQIEAKSTCHHFGGKINWFDKNMELEKRVHDWRTKMQAWVQGRVQLKDSIGSNDFKLVLTNLDRGPYLKWANVKH
jgi:hypothetical protein